MMLIKPLAKPLAAAALLAASALVARPAAAQLSTAPGIFAGVAVPTGDFGDVAKTGQTVGVDLRIKPMLLPVAARLDGAYNRFTSKLAAGSDDHTTLWSFTADGELDVPLTGIYVLAGVGAYSGASGGSTSTHFGENVGVGLRLPVPILRIYAEARYHHVNSGGSGTSYVPLTIGVNF